MAGEGRAVSPEGSPDTPPHARAEGSTVTLGLIPAPDIPEKIATELASELPNLLGDRVDGSVSWEVSVEVDPLTGTDREAPEILVDECRERMLGEGWDLAVCLTDLPVYRDGRLVVADLSAKRGVAGLSLPALGAMWLRPRAKEATLRLAEELYEKTREPASKTCPGQGQKSAGFVGPFRRIDPPDQDMVAKDVDARFAATGLLAHLRLWAGMVLANRPWRMLPAFKGAIAAAFATGAYVLVISSMWLLADAVGFLRLLALMVAAIVAMVGWIIVAHHLWEHTKDPHRRKWAALYNGVSVLTVGAAVLLAYTILFALLFAAAWVFVPGSYFQSILKHPVGLGEYLTLAWLGTSLATVAGALGASLEDEETVREASYGYRQRRRQEDQTDSQEG